jgi:hypothetical protein
MERPIYNFISHRTEDGQVFEGSYKGLHFKAIFGVHLLKMKHKRWDDTFVSSVGWDLRLEKRKAMILEYLQSKDEA